MPSSVPHLAGAASPPPSTAPGRKLKVCLATWAPFLGGAEVACERLAVGLQQAGHDVFVVLGQRNAVFERVAQAGVRCLYSPMPFTDRRHWWTWFKSRWQLRRLLKRERPDVLHSNDLPTHQAMAGAARGLGIPRVCHHRFPFAKEGIDWFNKFGAERHLFVSRALMEQMCATSARLRERPCVVVYDGLELPPRPSSEDRTRARDQLQLPPDRRVVTFAGQIVRRKGVADLLHAWVRLPADVAGTALLLIIGEDLQGQGAYRAEMEQFARDLHCPARFVGFQKNVGTWLLASDVAVVPSHVEPLGNATLEAMSYALPVIGGAVGGIPEMVVHEETGLLVPPRAPDQLAAALTRLLGDDAWRQRLGEQGRLRCERLFALRAHVENVMRQYDQVLHDVAEVARIQG